MRIKDVVIGVRYAATFDGVVPQVHLGQRARNGEIDCGNRTPVYGTTCSSFRLDSNQGEHERRDDNGVETGLLKSLGMIQATARH